MQTTIRGLVNKFQQTGNVCSEKRSRLPSSLQETVETTHRLSREYGIPKSTVWQTLHFTLKKKAYHIQVLHRFEPENYAACMAMHHNLFEEGNN